MAYAGLGTPWGRASEFLVIGGVGAVIVVLLGLHVIPMTQSQAGFAAVGDHHKYLYMAEVGPWEFHVAPFCWRLGVPLAVRALPFDTQTSFMLVTFAGLWATGVGMYWLGRTFGKLPVAGMFAMLAFFSVGWATKYAVFNFWLPDPAALAIVTMAIGCVMTRRAGGFAVFLAVGVLVKESVIFAAPLWWTLPKPADGPKGRWAIRGLFMVLPAVVVLAGLRVAIPAKNHDAEYVKSLPPRLTEVDEGRTSYVYAEQLERVSWQRVRDVSVRFLETAHSYTVGSLGVLPVALPFFAIRRNARLLARLSPFLVLVYAQLLVATDTQRLLVLALPAMVLMSLNGLESLTRFCKARAAAWLLLPALIIGLNLWQANRMAGPSWVEACIVAVCLGAMWIRGRWRQADAGAGSC